MLFIFLKHTTDSSHFNKLNISFSLLFFATNAKLHISLTITYAFSTATNKCSNSERVTMDYIPLDVALKNKPTLTLTPFLTRAENFQ